MFPLELIILDHYARESRCLLGSLPAILGRGEKDDILLSDPWISHSHCELFQQGEALVVRDLNSKNGIFMHGVRVREAEVLPGDCLTLGRTEITLRYQRATSDDVAAPSNSPVPSARRPTIGRPTTEELLY
jgi:pSer/pThr/pTyr-binding forkhead associated (FHA) protein